MRRECIDDMDVFLPSEALVDREDAGVVTLALKFDFMLNVVIVFLLAHFDCHLLARSFLCCLVATVKVCGDGYTVL